MCLQGGSLQFPKGKKNLLPTSPVATGGGSINFRAKRYGRFKFLNTHTCFPPQKKRQLIFF